MSRHLFFLIPAAALSLIALGGCSAYTQSASVTPVNDVRTDARACQFATANPAQLIDDMDGCMAQKGWVRK